MARTREGPRGGARDALAEGRAQGRAAGDLGGAASLESPATSKRGACHTGLMGERGDVAEALPDREEVSVLAAQDDGEGARVYSSKFTVADGCQILPSLLVASAALAATGGLLDAAQHWSMFERRSAYFIAMPMLFGLKGNLDMTLASRLSSALHAGALSQPRVFYEAGMALVMVQAIVCGLIAGVLTVIMSAVSGTGGNSQVQGAEGQGASLNSGEAIAVVASVMLASMVAAFAFGLMTFGLVFGGNTLGCDPDNFATPLVSSVGDMASLVILACSAYFVDWFADWGGLGDMAPVVFTGFGWLRCLFCGVWHPRTKFAPRLWFLDGSRSLRLWAFLSSRGRCLNQQL